MQALGVQHIYLGQEDKTPAFEALLTTLNLKAEQCVYMGTIYQTSRSNAWLGRAANAQLMSKLWLTLSPKLAVTRGS